MARAGQRSEEEGQKQYGPVKYGPVRHIGIQIGITPGITSAITDAWVEYLAGSTWTRTDEVPQGATFRIKANFTATKTSSGTAWAAGVTCMETTHKTIKNWGAAGGLLAGAEIHGPVTLSNYGASHIMPSYDLNLRFKLWGNDDHAPADPPTESLW